MAFKKKTVNRARYVRDEKVSAEKKSDQPSMTVPNDTMPLREIIDRFQVGRVIPKEIQAVYEEEGKTIIDTSRMSKIEKAQLYQETLNTIRSERKKLEVLEKTRLERDGTVLEQEKEDLKNQVTLPNPDAVDNP